jgi:hypothetical protein
MFILAIGRAGPVKNWAVPWLISFSFLVIILRYSVHLTRMWSSIGSGSSPALLAFFFVIPTVWYLRFLARMIPVRCPECGQTALIPLMKVGKQDERSANTRWCAGCGAMYWKDRQRVWQQEKRTTWYDRQMREGVSQAGDKRYIAMPTLKSRIKASSPAPTTDPEPSSSTATKQF